MSERQQRIRLGAFLLGSLALLAGMVLFFGGAPNWFASTKRYVIIFSDAPGVASGTPVRKSGVKVGEVSSIDLDDVTGQVKVVVHLNSQFHPRTSDDPTVTRGLLVGDTSIDFIPKLPGAPQPGEPLPPGTVLHGVSPFNAKLLIEQATGVVPEAQKSMAQLRKTLESFERMTPQMESTLKEIGDLAKSGREFIPELKRTNDGLRDLFANGDLGPALQNIVPELRKTMDEARFFLKTSSFWIEEVGVSFKKNEPRLVKAVDTLTTTVERVGEVFTPENQKSIANILKSGEKMAMGAEDLIKDGKTAMKTLNSTLTQTEQAIAEARQVISERVPKILENIDNGSDQFSKTMIEVREIVKAVGRSDGTLMKFITDPTLFNNVNEATAAFVRLMPRLDRILKDAEVFADKIARHPELIGFRGVINPSSGLKEAPTAPAFKPPHGQ